jgi:hypothetical protein
MSPSEWTIETASPTGEFRVRLKGKTEAPDRIYYAHGNHYVTYSVAQNSREILNNAGLHDGDQYDDLFLDLYPQYEWVNDATLHFGHQEKNREQKDLILIVNNSSKEIGVLETGFGNSDIFLSIGLKPKAEVKLEAPAQADGRHDTSGLSCVLRDGYTILEQSAGFKLRGKSLGPVTYFINIQDSSISITSDRLEATDPHKRN